MKINGGFWKKFAMKWRFRLDHARVIFGLFTFSLLLAVGYVEYIPFLAKLGFWGVVILTLGIFVVFGIGGYVYDKVMELWSEHAVVRVERTPYTFVPQPKEHIIRKALDYVLMFLLSKHVGVEEEAEQLKIILDSYYSLSPNSQNYKEKSDRVKLLTSEFIKKLKEKMKE